MNSEWVRCCKVTKNHNLIYLREDNTFRLSDNDLDVEYCPWCGKLLDTNLVEG